MRSSAVLAILSAGVLAAAFPKELKKDQPACHGDVFNNLCCVNGQWAGPAVSSAVTGFASSVTSFYSAHSSSIQGDVSTAASKGAAWVSSNSGSLSSFITSNSAAIKSDFRSIKSSIATFVSTFTPTPDPFAKRDSVPTPVVERAVPDTAAPVDPLITPPPAAPVLGLTTLNNALNAAQQDEAAPQNVAENPDTPEPIAAPGIGKRSVSVVSQGLTCYGQAVVTLSASDASSLIASATSAASGIKYFANGSSGTALPPATATSSTSTSSTSTLTAGAARNTRGPMMAMGGAAIAFAFAAM